MNILQLFSIEKRDNDGCGKPSLLGRTNVLQSYRREHDLSFILFSTCIIYIGVRIFARTESSISSTKSTLNL